MPAKIARCQRLAACSLIAAMCIILPAGTQAAPADNGGVVPAQPEIRVEALPEIVKLVPGDAAAALMVPKLEAIETEVGAMMKAVGVGADDAKTPVTSLLKQAGLSQGVDLKRGMAVVLPEFNMMGQPKPIIVLPVTGEGEFLANFQNVEKVEGAEGMVQGRTKAGNLGQTYMRVQGGYAYLAEESNPLKRFDPGKGEAGALWKRLGEVGQTQFASNQATGYLNLEKVGPMVAPLVQMGLMQAKAQMRNNPEQMEELGGPEAAAAMIDMYGRAIKSVLTNGTALVGGVAGGAEGAAIRYGVQFKPDSEPAKIFTPQAAPRLTLNRLPDGPTLIAGVMDARSFNFGPVAEGFDAVVKQMPEDTPMRKLMGVYSEGLKMTGLVDQASLAWYAPEVKEGEAPAIDDAMKMALVYTSDDPKKLAKANADYNRSMIEAMTELAEAQDMDKETFEKVRAAMKVETGVGKINGQPVDRMRFDLGAMAMQPGGGDLPQALKGKLDLFWTATDKAMVAASGEKMDLLKQTLATAEGSGKLGMRSAYRELRRHLPPGRCAEFFVDVEAFGKWIAAMEGEGAEAVPEMGPIAFSMSSRSGGAGATVYLPSTVLKPMVEGLGGLLGLFMMGAGPGAAPAAPPAGF